MIDEYENHRPGLTSPAEAAERIIPDSAKVLDHATRAIYVGTGGDLSVELVSGDVVTFRNLTGGTIYPLRVRRVRNGVDSTASDLVGLR